MRTRRARALFAEDELANFAYNLGPAIPHRAKLNDGTYIYRRIAPVPFHLTVNLTEHIAYGFMESGDAYAAVVLEARLNMRDTLRLLCLVSASNGGLLQRDCYLLRDIAAIRALRAHDAIVTAALVNATGVDSTSEFERRRFVVRPQGFKSVQ